MTSPYYPPSPAPPPAWKQVHCSDCGNKLTAGDQFCSKCGRKLVPRVKKGDACECGQVYAHDDAFCIACGKALPEIRCCGGCGTNYNKECGHSCSGQNIPAQKPVAEKVPTLVVPPIGTPGSPVGGKKKADVPAVPKTRLRKTKSGSKRSK